MRLSRVPERRSRSKISTSHGIGVISVRAKPCCCWLRGCLAAWLLQCSGATTDVGAASRGVAGGQVPECRAACGRVAPALEDSYSAV